MEPSLAVIVPAYNEEAGIGKTLKSLLLNPNISVVVVADNCTDKTAEISREHGVRVLERHDLSRRGKPAALRYALSYLMKEEFRYFAFVDADTEVEPNFSFVVMDAFNKGVDAVQVRYAQRYCLNSFKERLLDIAFTAMCTLRPLGRKYWGFSCGILGNGFALKREVIEKVPFSSDSIVEDLVTHICLVLHDYKVSFDTKTTVWAALPKSVQGERMQRLRWVGGRFAAIKSFFSLLVKSVLRGNKNAIESLLDLALLPLFIHTALLGLLLLFPGFYIRMYALFGLIIVFLYCLMTLYIRNLGWRDVAALFLSPFYILWNILWLPRFFKAAKESIWSRTKRDGEKQ